MYLRRKVFSCQPSLEEIINEVEERAFSAGYEQRMFDEEVEKEKKKSHTSDIVGAGIAGGLVGTSGALLAGSRSETFQNGLDAIRNRDEVSRNIKYLRGKVKDKAAEATSGMRDVAEKLLKKDATGNITIGNSITTAEEFRNMSNGDRTKLLDKVENSIKKEAKEHSKLSNLGKYAENGREAEAVRKALARNKMLKIVGGVAAGTGLASAGLAALHYKNKDKNKD